MIDLVWLSDAPPPPWAAGQVHPCPRATPAAVAALVQRLLAASRAEAWFFCDGGGGVPSPAYLEELARGPFQAVHAGLRLGQAGRPALIDFVRPVWTFNRDPHPDLAALSWRVSLRACLVKADVVRQLGPPSAEFGSLDGMALEWGHRWLDSGVLVRHDPALAETAGGGGDLPLEDEVLFVLFRFGRGWLRWGAARAVMAGYAPRGRLLRASRAALARGGALEDRVYRHDRAAAPAAGARVSVLVPTLDRYRYLEKVLDGLRRQTVAPYEVIVVDQTAPAGRDLTLAKRFAPLPLRVMHQDEPGQCSSRNWAIREATGEWILLLDDDVEVQPDLIERHLGTCARFGADVSCGVAEEVGAGPLPAAFRHLQASGVFPAGNTLVHREALRRSGLFDPAFERRQNEDGELGLRVYLSGAVMVLNPEISVLHHRAPRGGLRAHGARVVTRASSRRNLLHRNLPTASEIYLMRRHFSERQTREALWQRVVATLRAEGSRGRRAAQVLVSALLLPDTLWKLRRNARDAAALLRSRPPIPRLGPGGGEP